MGVRGTADGTKWELSHRYLSGQIDRAGGRYAVTLLAVERKDLGITIGTRF